MAKFNFTLPPIYREPFANGLVLLVQPLSHTASVAVGLNVNIGSRDETPAEAGLSHLIEHMLFQGTRRRDTRELGRVINAVGGQLDACTGRESTTYYAKVPAPHFPLALDVLQDMVAHSTFSDDQLEKEKQVIIEEIHMYEDAPDELVHDLFAQTLWPGHALGRPILGTRARLSQFKRPKVMDYFHRHYQPSRMILAIAGNITILQAHQWAKRAFGKLKLSTAKPFSRIPVPITRYQNVIQARPLEQVHLCLGVRGIAFADHRRLAALAFSNILGGSTNSRLFFEVRERRALSYSIFSFVDFYADTGIAGIYVACPPKKIKKTLQVIHVELARMVTHPVSAQELRDVRQQMEGNLLLSLESTSAHIWHMFYQEHYLQRPRQIPEILKAIRKITKEDILNIAQTFFVNTPVAYAVCGPIQKSSLPEFSLTSSHSLLKKAKFKKQ